MVLDWHLRAGDLVLGRLAFDIDLTGPRSLLTGVLGGGLTGIGVSGLDGRLGPEVLALIPGGDAPVCDSTAVIQGVGLRHSRGGAGAQGSITITEGVCTRPGATPMQVPALSIDLTSDQGTALARAQTRADPDTLLAEARLAADRLFLQLEPAGARLVPGLPSSAATILEYPL